MNRTLRDVLLSFDRPYPSSGYANLLIYLDRMMKSSRRVTAVNNWLLRRDLVCVSARVCTNRLSTRPSHINVFSLLYRYLFTSNDYIKIVLSFRFGSRNENGVVKSESCLSIEKLSFILTMSRLKQQSLDNGPHSFVLDLTGHWVYPTKTSSTAEETCLN